MSTTPAALRELLSDPALGLRPVRPEAQDELLRAAFAERLFGDDEAEAALRASGASLVALGPDAIVQRGAARRGQARPAAWWARGERLFVAPLIACPPELWCEVERTPAGVARAAAALGPGAGGEKSFRFLFGVLPNFIQDFLALENRLTVDPFCEGLPLVLGSAAPGDGRSDCFDDPAHVSQFETLRSRSRIALAAMHQLLPEGSIAVGVVEYRPAPHADVVRAYNEAHGADWPLDVPLDVLGAVGFGQGQSLSRFESWIGGAPGPVDPATAMIFGASIYLAPGPARLPAAEFEAFLRRHSQSGLGAVRAITGQTAAMIGAGDLLDAMVAAEREPELRELFASLRR